MSPILPKKINNLNNELLANWTTTDEFRCLLSCVTFLESTGETSTLGEWVKTVVIRSKRNKAGEHAIMVGGKDERITLFLNMKIIWAHFCQQQNCDVINFSKIKN